MKLSSFVIPLLSATLARVEALHTGAASCQGGQAATTGGHGPTSTSGDLSETDYTIFIDGKELSPEGTVTFPVGKEVPIKLTGANFKGFLLRLSSASGIETKDALSSEEDNVQVSSLCVDQESVGGLTHTFNDEKTIVEGFLLMDEVATDLILDVTVVIQNNNGNSQYAYGGFQVSAEPPATEPPATEPPVTEPPVTEPPVTEPPATEPPVTEPPAAGWDDPVTEPPAATAWETEPPAATGWDDEEGTISPTMNGTMYDDKNATMYGDNMNGTMYDDGEVYDDNSMNGGMPDDSMNGGVQDDNMSGGMDESTTSVSWTMSPTEDAAVVSKKEGCD